MPDQTLLLGQLADEFTARVRAGQMPDIAEYAAQHPELAARIRELFPTLMLLEGMAGTGAQGPAAASPAIVAGTVFGNYRIERELGRGGMGVVYLALHQPLGKHVALKVLAVRAAAGTGQLERFLREAKTAASLHHTNIVPVFDVGQCAGTPYYAMQYIEGRGLDQVLRDLSSGNRAGEAASDPLGPTLTPEAGAAFDAAMSKLESREPPPDHDGTGHAGRVGSTTISSRGLAIPRGHVAWAEFFRWAADLGIQAAEGIAHAHQRGVIHRDIKPSNLILDSQGVLWITDFGLARRVDDPGLTKSGSLLGTPRYMSPEQAAAAQRPIDHRTDIYSLGASLYELLACRPAFMGATPMEVVIQILDREPVAPHRLNPAVPTDLETIVLKAMAKRPEDRYQSAAEVADDLRRWLAFEPIRARQTSPLERLARWCRRNPAVATLTTTVAALLLTIAVTASIAAVQMRTLAAGERDAAFAAEKSRQTAQDALGAEKVALVNAEQARNRAEEARAEAERDRNRAVASHEQSLDHLARSLFEQAHALGTSRQTGRRWQILDQLREAELIRRRERPAGTVGAIDATGARVTAAAEAALRGLPAGAALRSEALTALLVSDGRVRRASELGLVGVVPPAISRDGRILAVPWIDVGSQTSGARLIDLSGEQAERRLELPNTPFAGLALDGSGRLLATGTMAGVTLWAIPSGEKRETLPWPVDRDDQGAAGPFAPPGEIIVSLSDDGRHVAARRSLRGPDEGARQIVVWDLDGSRAPQVLVRGKLHGGGIAFSVDGSRLAFPSSTTGVSVWNFESGEKSPEITPSLKWGGQLEFCHADQWLVLGAHPQGTDEGAAVLWDLEAHRELTRLNRGFALAISASPDSRLLAVAGLLNEIRILRIPQGDEVARLEGAHVTVISLVRWTADGRELVSVGIDGSLRQWDLATDVPLSTIDAGLANAARLAFSPDGRWLAVAPGMATRPEDASRLARPGNAPPIRLIDRASGRVEKEFALGVVPGGLVFRSDSRRLAALSAWSAVAWEIGTGEVLARFDGQRPPDQVMALSCGFDEAGNLLVTRRMNKRLTVFNPALERDVWQPPNNADVSLGFLSPDSQRLVVWPTFDFKPQTWTVWNLPEGVPAVQLPWSGATNLGAPVFSRDHDWLAISYLELDARALGGPAPTGPNQRAEYGVALFHLPTARKQITIRGTTAPTAYDISPDSRLLAIGQRDGSVLLWDVAAAEELLHWESSSAPVASVSFAPDGNTLAACDGQSGAVRLLDLAAIRREFSELGLPWELGAARDF